ncbi:MAG TPA: hypothetical protein VH475_00780 [Tepidisphaeraceae bacterium]|jgi:hypothetical protein
MNHRDIWLCLLLGVCFACSSYADTYDDFNQRVAQYNSVASGWNNGTAFFPQVNSAVTTFNTQVDAFNTATNYGYGHVPSIAGPSPSFYPIIDPTGNPDIDNRAPGTGGYDGLVIGIDNGTVDRLTFNNFVDVFNAQVLNAPEWNFALAQPLAPAALASPVPEPSLACIGAMLIGGATLLRPKRRH